MKYIFICANYAGLEENYFKFLRYCKYVADKGHVPISIVTMYHSALDENVPAQNDIIISAAKQLLSICDEVWVFGKCSESLIANVSESGKPVIYVKDSFSLNDSSVILSVIMQEYVVQTGKPTNRGILESALYYLNQGITSELIIAAIKKTAKANAGWNYTEGILKNCLTRGITTSEQFSHNDNIKQKTDYSAYDLDLFEQMLNSKD